MCSLNDGLSARMGALDDIPNGDGLRGAVSHGFVTIAGPCGEHHLLSWSVACALYSWLGRKLSADMAMNAHVPKRHPGMTVIDDPRSAEDEGPSPLAVLRWFHEVIPGHPVGEWISDALAKERANG